MPSPDPKPQSDRRPGLFDSLKYRCGFCRVVQHRVPRNFAWHLIRVLGLSRYYCPHCFQIQIRPSGWLRLVMLPFRVVAHCLVALRNL